MAPMVPVLVGAGVGMQALGMYQQGVAAQAEAEGQAAVAKYNAKVAQQQAQAEQQVTAYKQRQQAEEASRYASSLRAGLGASGVVPSEGTPLLIQATQAAQSELDNLMIGYEGQIAAQRATNQGQLENLQADIYRKRGRSGFAAGLTGAGTSLLTGFSDLAYKKWGM